MAFGPADPTHYMLLITGFAWEHAVAVPRDGTFTMRGSIEVEAAVLTTVCRRCGQLLLYPDTGAPPVVVDAARDAQRVGRCGPQRGSSRTAGAMCASSCTGRERPDACDARVCSRHAFFAANRPSQAHGEFGAARQRVQRPNPLVPVMEH